MATFLGLFPSSATDNVIDVVEKEDEVCVALSEPEKKKRKSRGTTGRLGCDFCDYRCDKPSVMIMLVYKNCVGIHCVLL